MMEKKIYNDQIIFKTWKSLINIRKDVFIAIVKQIKNAKTDFGNVVKIKCITTIKDYLENIKLYDKSVRKIGYEYTKTIIISKITKTKIILMIYLRIMLRKLKWKWRNKSIFQI
jgi:hypothetical protein